MSRQMHDRGDLRQAEFDARRFIRRQWTRQQAQRLARAIKFQLAKMRFGFQRSRRAKAGDVARTVR